MDSVDEARDSGATRFNMATPMTRPGFPEPPGLPHQAFPSCGPPNDARAFAARTELPAPMATGGPFVRAPPMP